MGKARFYVAAELLHHLLRLPATATILRGPYEIWVEHKDIPETADGQEYPLCVPSFASFTVEKDRIPEFAFTGWNVKERDAALP